MKDREARENINLIAKELGLDSSGLSEINHLKNKVNELEEYIDQIRKDIGDYTNVFGLDCFPLSTNSDKITIMNRVRAIEKFLGIKVNPPEAIAVKKP